MIKTVGELRKALAAYHDDAPIWAYMFGGKTSLKAVADHEREVFVVPAGLGDLFEDYDDTAVTVKPVFSNPPA